MRFTGEKAAFGRHETFALRYGWITKGMQALVGSRSVFEAEDATVQLGVGKNMVASIRYWLQAARLIERTQEGWDFTEVGTYLFDDDGEDPYLEDEGTIWLIHWLLASNPELATSWWWFFNRFHKHTIVLDIDGKEIPILGRYRHCTLISAKTPYFKYGIDFVKGKEAVKEALKKYYK